MEHSSGLIHVSRWLIINELRALSLYSALNLMCLSIRSGVTAWKWLIMSIISPDCTCTMYFVSHGGRVKPVNRDILRIVNVWFDSDSSRHFYACSLFDLSGKILMCWHQPGICCISYRTGLSSLPVVRAGLRPTGKTVPRSVSVSWWTKKRH